MSISLWTFLSQYGHYLLLPALYGVSRWQFRTAVPVQSPYRRCDPSIAKPFIWPLTIGFWHVLGWTSITPTILLALSEHFYPTKEADHVLYAAATKFLFGWLLAGIFVTTTKHATGRLRPHFLAANKIEFDANDQQLYFSVTGQGDERIGHPISWKTRESRLSFFSGHAILGMYAAVYLVIYVQEKISPHTGLFVHLAQFLTILGGLYPGVTQGRTFWHHWSDVIAGHAFGILAAYLTFYHVHV